MVHYSLTRSDRRLYYYCLYFASLIGSQRQKVLLLLSVLRIDHWLSAVEGYFFTVTILHCYLLQATDSFWLTWKIWVYVVIGVRPAGRLSVMWQKLDRCDFLVHCKHAKCQTVHDGSIYWALPIHTTSSDLDCISRSQQCQPVWTEYFMFLSD